MQVSDAGSEGVINNNIICIQNVVTIIELSVKIGPQFFCKMYGGVDDT